MSFTLEKIVPWGRSFDEYISMFSLSANDLKKKILGCGDGPASFNAELTKIGGIAVFDACFFRFGNPSGYVFHEKIKNFNTAFFVCVGPLLINTILCQL